MIKIKEPIWKDLSVGLSERKLTNPTRVKILYRNKSRELEFPNTYKISRERALSYPAQIRRGNRLRIIPIEDMEVA